MLRLLAHAGPSPPGARTPVPCPPGGGAARIMPPAPTVRTCTDAVPDPRPPPRPAALRRHRDDRPPARYWDP
ncbi:hypothetical protein Col01nite_10050 [Cellulomonas oligotrophica]|uniref:Uncharacterized protein n=1 Tax=Cellulomonas oligotrophica TaxID=931536 RepID=A0ABQ4D7Y5_9CELL|nr:hypothetical protein Col01nite_10050 [Cellulomonas oligotrophica]